MKLIYRYIFCQILGALGLAVGLFVFVLVSGNIIRDIAGLLASGRLSASLFFYFLGLLIPYVVAYALPLGMAACVLMVFGRLSAQREIVAMKSAGLSIYRISAPVFFVAWLGMLLCLAINLYYAPLAKAGYKHGIIAALRSNPVQFLQPKIIIKDFPGYRIYVGDRDNDQLKDLWIWELNDSDEVRMLIKAKSGEFSLDDNADVLILTLTNGTGEHRTQPNLSNIDDPMALPTLVFNKLDIRFPLTGLFKGQEVKKKISMLTFDELLERRSFYLERERAGDDKAFGERIRVQTQIQKAIAMAFGMLALTAIAIPLGIQANRSETYANITLALGLTLVYYFMIVMISWLEEAPQFRPDILIWLPNILYQSLGLYLLQRSNQH